MAEIERLNQVRDHHSQLRVKEDSRTLYNCKIAYVLKFFRDNFPGEVEDDKLKLPLSFAGIDALFAKLKTDTDLPRISKKRKLEQDSRRLREIDEVTQALALRGEEPDEPLTLENYVDSTIGKMNSITIAKTTLGGYKSALKLYYTENKQAFSCPELPIGHLSLDDYLNDVIKTYAGIITDKKVRNIMSIREGKTAMTEEGYNNLLRRMIKYRPTAANRNMVAVYIYLY